MQSKTECHSIAESTFSSNTATSPTRKIRKQPRRLQDFVESLFFCMRTLKLVLAYDGSDFCGWQIQPDSHSIQGALSVAIGRVTGENVLPQGSGRTDAGVHALAQVASFRTASPIPP